MADDTHTPAKLLGQVVSLILELEVERSDENSGKEPERRGGASSPRTRPLPRARPAPRCGGAFCLKGLELPPSSWPRALLRLPGALFSQPVRYLCAQST